MIDLLIIDKDKNSVKVQISDEVFSLLRGYFDTKDIKVNKNFKNLDKEVRKFIKEMNEPQYVKLEKVYYTDDFENEVKFNE